MGAEPILKATYGRVSMQKQSCSGTEQRALKRGVLN